MCKKTLYLCHTCKKINPKLILVENYDVKNGEPYKIQILTSCLDKNKYKINNIFLRKKVKGNSYKIYKCWNCQNSLEVIKKERSGSFIKNIDNF